MDKGYWEGQVDQCLQFNDKEHERIFDAVGELRKDVGSLKIDAAKSGSKWGAITAAAVSALMMVASFVWAKICGN